MTIFPWMWLLAIKQFLNLTCPYTRPIISVLSIFELTASVAFFILIPFFAPHWWYILIAICIYLVTIIITPRIDANAPRAQVFHIYSFVGSIVSPVLLVLMYLSLLEII